MDIEHDPQSTEEWQEAVDLAYVGLLLESARQYGLVIVGAEINLERCEEILRRGDELGIRPSPNAVERMLGQEERGQGEAGLGEARPREAGSGEVGPGETGPGREA